MNGPPAALTAAAYAPDLAECYLFVRRSATMKTSLAATAFLIVAVCPVVPFACRGASPGAAAERRGSADKAAPPSATSDECVRGRPEPILAAPAGAPAPTFRRLGAYKAEETTRLRGNVEVSVRQFGCAHYAVEFALSIPDAPLRKLPPAAGLQRAALLLEELTVVPAQQAALRSIAEFLRAHASVPYAYGRALRMSEMETVSVRAEAAPAGTRLLVLYDVAL